MQEKIAELIKIRTKMSPKTSEELKTKISVGDRFYITEAYKKNISSFDCACGADLSCRSICTVTKVLMTCFKFKCSGHGDGFTVRFGDQRFLDWGHGLVRTKERYEELIAGLEELCKK